MSDIVERLRAVAAMDLRHTLDTAEEAAAEIEQLKEAVMQVQRERREAKAEIKRLRADNGRLTAEVAGLKEINSQRQETLAQEIIAHRATRALLEANCNEDVARRALEPKQ